MSRFVSGVLRGAAAGAAGTTALNAVTYLDMAARGRPASTTPQETIEQIADKVGLHVPGEGDERQNRLRGLGPLLGLIAGMGAGAIVGGLRAGGWRPRIAGSAALAGLVAMLAGSVPMAAFGVSDRRSWSAQDWAADIVPHAAYGTVAALVLAMLETGRTMTTPDKSPTPSMSSAPRRCHVPRSDGQRSQRWPTRTAGGTIR